MKSSFLRKRKKYIAGLLTVILLAGTFQGAGKIDSSAQEKTLPGIEQLVSDYIASGETFHILEVVPDRSDASIGYLVGGEEPVIQGKKLSHMPAAYEREQKMQELAERIGQGYLDGIAGENGPVEFSGYVEGQGTRTEEIRGKFVYKEDCAGDYNYAYSEAVYRMLADGETANGQRYDRMVSFHVPDEENDTDISVAAVFSPFAGTSDYVETLICTEKDVQTGYAVDRYAMIPYEKMSGISLETFDPAGYVGREVYTKQGEDFSYYGKVVYGSELPDEYVTVSDGNAATVSSGNMSGKLPDEQEPDIAQNLYLLNPVSRTAYLWAVFHENEQDGGSYSFDHLADGYFLEFSRNPYGEYYISKAVQCTDGNLRLEEEYLANDTGKYVVEVPQNLSVLYRGQEGFDESAVYDFVGDGSMPVQTKILYNGGFYSREWFKKSVMNLSGNSRYEAAQSGGGDIDSLKIEVSTITLQELSDLVQNGTHYGVDIENVDFVYLSGRGTYTRIEENLKPVADKIAQLAYGVTEEGVLKAEARVPVVVDYLFYEKNKVAGNGTMAKLSAFLLQIGDEENGNRLLSQNGMDWEAMALEPLAVKEALAENIYLNDDSAVPYVSDDYLKDFADPSMMETGHKAETFSQVLEEIKYENFLEEKNAASEGREARFMAESISKASITRYILNYSMHRILVKSSLQILDLEPCYDYEEATRLKEQDIKEFMNQPEYSGDINLVQMSSAEFIGKVEDMNEQYDMIYVGARTGAMNTDEQGRTVYNDSSMNGLIYTHTGDIYDYSGESSSDKLRLRDDSIGAYDFYRGPGNDMNSTREKEFEQYIEAGYPVVFADAFFLEANGIVSVNPDTVDCNSQFYRLMEFALTLNEDGTYKYWQKNVYTEKQLKIAEGESEQQLAEREKRQREFCNYLNLSKLEISWVTDLGEEWRPVEYRQSTDDAYFLKEQNGHYQMQFIFSLKNDAALSQVGTTYDCKLYVDNNADGRFAGADLSGEQNSSASEELDGLSIYVRKGTEWETVSPVIEKEGARYKLATGQTYKLVRRLPDDYQGVLPWKLVFYDNADRLVRTSQTGYTAINRGGKESIRILQLMSDKEIGSGKERWNLEKDSDLTGQGGLLSQIPGFEVDIDSRYTSQFIYDLGVSQSLDNQEKLRNEYYSRAKAAFHSYDMIILGFGDNYAFGNRKDDSKKNAYNYKYPDTANMAVSEAVRDYIESGKSVLFTHDSSSYINSTSGKSQSWYWGYEFNKTMRAAVGLDRFGALKEYYLKMSQSGTDAARQRYQAYYDILDTQYNYDSVYRPKEKGTTLPQKEGLTKYTTVRYLTDKLTELSRDSQYTGIYFPVKNSLLYTAMYKEEGVGSLVSGQYTKYKDSGAGPSLTATLVNEGQITTYPFKISDEGLKTLSVAATHYQWMQPNMELDKDKDGKNDIVVWYCLSDLSQEARAKKARSDGSPENIYSISPNDVVNNYYIYSMGNVTYSGAGHTKPTGLEEKKLFVNTMVAAYSAGVKAPVVEIKDDAGEKLDTVYLLYDAANQIVLNGQEKIQMSLKAVDYNILSGQPEIRLEVFLADPKGIEAEGITEKVRPVSAGISLKSAAGTLEAVPVTGENSFDGYFHGQYFTVQNGIDYQLKVNTGELGLFTDTGGKVQLKENSGAGVIYLRVTTVYDNGSQRTESSAGQVCISAADLFDLK